MQFYKLGDGPPAYGAKKYWFEAINDPGAGQMQYLKALMLSRPYFERDGRSDQRHGRKRNEARLRYRHARVELPVCVHLLRQAVPYPLGRDQRSARHCKLVQPARRLDAIDRNVRQPGRACIHTAGRAARRQRLGLMIDDAAKHFAQPGTRLNGAASQLNGVLEVYARRAMTRQDSLAAIYSFFRPPRKYPTDQLTLSRCG